ncbi:MAG: TetR/AcrR family transcriptional regulator [Mycobacterium sp.]
MGASSLDCAVETLEIQAVHLTQCGRIVRFGSLFTLGARSRKAHPLASRAHTEGRIFDGALRAIARQGPKKLAMSDIAAEAGVSVGTLYRYFTNKDQLLASLGDHFVKNLQAVLQQSIADNPEPTDRLGIVIDVMLRFWLENPVTMQIGQLEPGFVLAYIKRVIPQLSAVLREALEPVLGDSAAVLGGSATLDEVVDLIVRMAFSHFFMPSRDYRDFRDVLVVLGASAGLEPRRSRGQRGRRAAG